jgi:hypothetical protein
MSEIDPFAPAQETWLGRSKRKDDKTPPSLDEALADAYDQARQANRDGQLTLRVIDILVTGSNPISEYGVIVGKGGGI